MNFIKDFVTDLAVDELERLARKELIELAIKEIAASKMSFLLSPVLNPMTMFVINWIIDFLIKKGDVLYSYLATKYSVELELKDVHEAITKNDGSEQAKADLINRARDFIRLRSQNPK